MTLLRSAREILDEGEIALRKLMVQAASKGDYAVLAKITRWASELGQVAAEDRNSTVRGTLSTMNGRGRARRKTSSAAQPDRAGGGLRRRSSGAASSYPRFLRDGGELVKVGWSKRLGAEYRHRVPKTVVDQLVSSISDVAATGDIVTMERILAQVGAADGDSAPTYQLYVALAWLRDEGLVRQHGRQGYSLARPVGLTSGAENRWDTLFSE